MQNCKNCNDIIKIGYLTECKNCGYVSCLDCAEKTKRICPNCYSDLEISG